MGDCFAFLVRVLNLLAMLAMCSLTFFSVAVIYLYESGQAAQSINVIVNWRDIVTGAGILVTIAFGIYLAFGGRGPTLLPYRWSTWISSRLARLESLVSSRIRSWFPWLR